MHFRPQLAAWVALDEYESIGLYEQDGATLCDSAQSHFRKLATAVGIVIQFLAARALPVRTSRSVVTLPNRMILRALHAAGFHSCYRITERYRLCVGAVPPTDSSLAPQVVMFSSLREHLLVRESKGGQEDKNDRRQ